MIYRFLVFGDIHNNGLGTKKRLSVKVDATDQINNDFYYYLLNLFCFQDI